MIQTHPFKVVIAPVVVIVIVVVCVVANVI